jgi:hypothetical protein
VSEAVVKVFFEDAFAIPPAELWAGWQVVSACFWSPTQPPAEVVFTFKDTAGAVVRQYSTALLVGRVPPSPDGEGGETDNGWYALVRDHHGRGFFKYTPPTPVEWQMLTDVVASGDMTVEVTAAT